MKKLKPKKGITLIEILLYFGIVAVLVTASFSFSNTILSNSQKSDNINKVQTDTYDVLQLISTAIQESSYVDQNQSTLESDTGLLHLVTNSTISNPTIFSISNGTISIQKGYLAPEQITANDVSCSQMRFELIETTKSPDQVLINLTCSQKATVSADQAATATLQTSVSLRRTP